MDAPGRPDDESPESPHDKLLRLAREVGELRGEFLHLHDEFLDAGEEPPFDLKGFALRMKYLSWRAFKLARDNEVPPPTAVYIVEMPPDDDEPVINIASLRRVWSEERKCRVFESVPIHLKLLVERIERALADDKVAGVLEFRWTESPF